MFSLASKASLYCTFHFSYRRGGSGVGLSQKASIPSGVLLFADCAMSYLTKLPSTSLREDTLLFRGWILPSEILTNF